MEPEDNETLIRSLNLLALSLQVEDNQKAIAVAARKLEEITDKFLHFMEQEKDDINR